MEFYSLISWTNIEAGYHKKVLDFSTLLLQNDRTEEALQALQVLRPWPKEEKDKMQQINLAVQKLLRVPVEKGNVELTHQLFDLLMKALMIPSINMMDPLVQVHLVRSVFFYFVCLSFICLLTCMCIYYLFVYLFIKYWNTI